MTRILAEGLGLGLSTGLYCLGACAPLFVPFMLAEGKPALRSNFWLVMEFMAGRLAAYLLFAAGASLLGERYGANVSGRLLSAGLLISGLLMLAYALVKNLPQLGLCAQLSRSLAISRLPLWLGFLVGINVCPPFAVGMIRLFAIGSVLPGMAYFAAFFVGTTLYMLPLLAAGTLARFERLKSIAAVASGLAGAYFAASGLAGLL